MIKYINWISCLDSGKHSGKHEGWQQEDLSSTKAKMFWTCPSLNKEGLPKSWDSYNL